MQYANLKDPYKYWDQQGNFFFNYSSGRRNYGEILYDHDNITDIWGIGSGAHASFARKSAYTFMAYVGLVLGLVWLWDPASQAKWVEPQFPFNNLSKALGKDE